MNGVQTTKMIYAIKSTKLKQEFIDNEIKNCLTALCNTNEMLFDYWLSELYDDEDNEVKEQWNEYNMKEMYKDVDNNAY